MTVHSTAGVCHVLLEDPDLAEGLPASARARLMRTCAVPELRIEAGPWPGEEAEPGDAVGMLVMDGLLIRRVGIDGRYGAELLGRGDLVRPWQEETGTLTLPLSSAWVATEPSRLAILDGSFATLLGRYPQLGGRVIGRAVRRSRHLTAHLAIAHQARVDVRLHMLFWHLASRFGRVRGDGVLVRLRLTHTILAELVAAQRPTVTSALSALAKQGLVRSLGGAWLLTGDPPGELGAFSPVDPDA